MEYWGEQPFIILGHVRYIRCTHCNTPNRRIRARCISTVYCIIYGPPNVPENTPIQSITRSARARQTATPIAVHMLDSLCGLDHKLESLLAHTATLE